MKDDQARKPLAKETARESGMPGGGQGRRDAVGPTGVYPVSSSAGASGDARIGVEPLNAAP